MEKDFNDKFYSFNKFSDSNVDVFIASNPFSNIIILPGLPNFGIKKDNKIIDYFTSKGSNLIFLDDKSQGLSLYNNTNSLIEYIKNGQLDGIDALLPIFLIGLSFGGGISIKVAKDNTNIIHTFALSPLTSDTCRDIDWEGLLSVVNNEIGSTALHMTVDDFKQNILNLLKIEGKLPLKLSVFGVDNDPEIIIPEEYEPIILKSSEIGIRHFGLRKTAGLSEEVKNKIFSIILKFNFYKSIQKDFVEQSLQYFTEENVYGICTHGSAAFYGEKTLETGETDVDFIIYLKNNFSGASEKLSSMLLHLKNKYPTIDFDISLFFLDTIEKLGLPNIVTSTHSPVYSLVFGNAKVLYGDNILKKSLNIFPKEEVSKSFIFEIGKYVDRLNRDFTKGKLDLGTLRKYLIRIIMCYMIARGNLNLVESNTFSPQTAIDYANHEFKGFQYLSFFLNLLNGEDVCISEVIDGLNLFLRDYGFYNQESSGKLIDYNINKLKKLVKVPGYKTIVSIPENISNLEEVVGV